MKKKSRIAGQILQVDYDRVLGLPDDECCFSLTQKEVAMILSQTEFFAWKTRWNSDSDTEINQDTIDALKSGLERKLMSGCCPDEGALHRFTEDGHFQTSTDGGETWVDDPDGDPRNNAIESPPLPGADSDAKKCAAADNVRDLFLQYRDNLEAMLDASPTLVSIIAGILAFIAVLTGISGVGIGISVLLMGTAVALLSMSSGDVEAVITTEVLDTFRCLVYCRMDNDGRITYDNWLGLLVDIAAEFDDFPELFFYQTINAMGFIGVNNAGSAGVATAEDCGDCDCPAECNDADLIQYGTVTETGVYDGHPGMEVEAVFAGGGYVVRWGTIDGGVPPNTCCYLFDVVVLEGSINSSYWTDCAGSGHGSPAPAGHNLGHFDYYFLAPAKIRILFGA